MKTFKLSILLISLTLTASSQNSLDIFTLAGTYGFPSAYEAPYTEKATETQGYASLTLPIVLSDKTVIFNNFNYYYFGVNTDASFAADVANPLKLHGIIARTGLVQKISDANSIQILFIPRYMSDFNKSDETAWQYGGVALFEHRFNDDLMMRYGALYNTDFFGHYLVPVVHVDWNITDKFAFSGMLPVYAKIKYKASEKLELGFSHFGLTTSYRLGKEYNNDYLVRQSIDLALYERYHLGSNIHFETRVGMALGRKYEQFANGDEMDLGLPLVSIGDDRQLKNIPFDNGPFVQMRLVYNLPLD